jgi:hypothetical protein
MLLTKEAAHMDDEMNRTPTEWKIMQCSDIPALDAQRFGPTRGTTSRSGCWAQRQSDLISDIYLLNEHLRKVKKVDHIWQLGEKTSR